MEEIDERLARLENKLDVIGSAVAELAQRSWPELHPLNPAHGSAQVSASLAIHAANCQRVIATYVDPANSRSAALERFVRDRDEAKKTARMSDAEAESMNRRLVKDHVSV